MWPFFKRRNNTFPDFIRDYLEQDFKIKSSEEIMRGNYLVLDCESTGVTKNASIITIGAVTYSRQKIDLSRVLDIRRALDRGSQESVIHGELSTVGADSDSTLQRQLMEYLGNGVIVGHHISFDIQLINRWMNHTFPGFKLKNKTIDTLALIKRLDPHRFERKVAGHDNLQLDSLCASYGIAVENRHTALGDAYMTAQLFHHLIGLLEKRGVTKLRQITS